MKYDLAFSYRSLFLSLTVKMTVKCNVQITLNVSDNQSCFKWKYIYSIIHLSHIHQSIFHFQPPFHNRPQHLPAPSASDASWVLFLSSLRPRQLPLAHLPTQRAVTEAPSRGETVTGGFWKPLKWPYDHIYDDGRWWVHIYFTLDSSRLQIVSFGCNMRVHTVNDMLWQKCSHGIPWDREAQVLVILSSYSVYSLA